VAASPAAADLVNPDGGVIVGHLFEEFTADHPTAGIDLFAGGRLNGFETFRRLRRRDGADAEVRMWIRSFDLQPASKFVVVVLVADGAGGEPPGQEWQEAPAVVGTADASLRIERISSDAEQLFDRPITDLVDESLLALVAEKEVPALLSGLSEASASQTGITLYLDINGTEGSAMRCEVLLLPLQPSPSCAFVFLPTPATTTGHLSGDLSNILLRLSRGAHIAQLARGVFRGITEATMPGLNRLTTRELEIASRLLDGDRPPEIANKLYLSQSTVRNHLAAVFAKLGVTSQQGLLILMRRSQSEQGIR
jgi:DNA-binding CsgD family transcriptional regulator